MSSNHHNTVIIVRRGSGLAAGGKELYMFKKLVLITNATITIKSIIRWRPRAPPEFWELGFPGNHVLCSVEIAAQRAAGIPMMSILHTS